MDQRLFRVSFGERVSESGMEEAASLETFNAQIANLYDFLPNLYSFYTNILSNPGVESDARNLFD